MSRSLISITLILCQLSIYTPIAGQAISTAYNTCAAILLNGDVLVNEYSPRGQCKIEADSKGVITLSPVILNESSTITSTLLLSYYVAVKDSKTNTLRMITPMAVHKYKIEEVLAQCQLQDTIVILTVDKRYSLPHHEIIVLEGC
jgi:hypothetical protein